MSAAPNIPGYAISGEIGRGGMAVVYRARQVLLDREVALKVLNPQLAQDTVNAQRFLQEARMLAALAHPHIVPVYDVGVSPEGLHYFSMQLFSGGDFGRKLREGIDETELVRVLLAVAQALGFAHARGYVHRDVTPANILFDELKRPVLTDFGIARALATTSRMTATGLSIGTSHYMSPEQARGHEVDRRSDIYSLGVLLYEALVGTTPFHGVDGFAVAYAHVHEPVPRLPEGLERWQALVDRATAKAPEERYPDCAAFIDGLRLAAPDEYAAVARKEGMTPPVRVAPASAPAAHSEPRAVAKADAYTMPAARPSKLPLYLAAAAVVAGVVLGGAYWFTVRPEATPATVSTSSPPKRAPEPPSRIEPKARTPAVPLRDDATPSEPATIEPVAIEPATPETVSTETTPATDLAQIEDNVALAQSIALGELPTVEDPIEKLLALGRGNLAGRRLTSPPGDNAVERFELVLRIEPRNAEAKAGLLAVAQAYYDLAAKIDRESALPQWLDQIARGEAIAKKHQGAAALAAAAALRQGYVDELLRRGAQAIVQWQREQAIALHQRALQVIPDAAAAQQGLRRAEQVGRPGYVFKDDGAMPEMIVAGRYALARSEVSVGEFRAYWRDAGQRKFGAATPSCRDRERFLTSSRKRTWQAPDYTQTDRHPVVCVNYAMAEDYARWLAARSGKRYRLPNAAEWRAAGATDVPATCAANVRDAAFRQSYGGREGTPCSDGHAAAAPTASFAARKSGLYDADGNVREWVSDCAAGCKERLALGASWNSEAGETPAPAYAADTGFNTIGFRVLRELD